MGCTVAFAPHFRRRRPHCTPAVDICQSGQARRSSRSIEQRGEARVRHSWEMSYLAHTLPADVNESRKQVSQIGLLRPLAHQGSKRERAAVLSPGGSRYNLPNGSHRGPYLVFRVEAR
jgi:hypothetical protein